MLAAARNPTRPTQNTVMNIWLKSIPFSYIKREITGPVAIARLVEEVYTPIPSARLFSGIISTAIVFMPTVAEPKAIPCTNLIMKNSPMVAASV